MCDEVEKNFNKTLGLFTADNGPVALVYWCCYKINSMMLKLVFEFDYSTDEQVKDS